MCHVSTGKNVSQMSTLCDCEYNCPVMLPIDDEIRSLEEYRKFMQERIEAIDRKIAALKTVKDR